MKTVSVHDLRYHFPQVEGLLRSGEEIGVTKRGQVIARLTIEPDAELAARPPVPDFLGRMKENFGDRILAVTGAEIISADRDDL
jgi:antitoxin (DNA-binding transcriptional repressor) of toxin-antitoxin stability system